jgi:hypothetical protein
MTARRWSPDKSSAVIIPGSIRRRGANIDDGGASSAELDQVFEDQLTPTISARLD